LKITVLLSCMLLASALQGFAAVGETQAPEEEKTSCPILIFHSVRPYRSTDPLGVRRYITTPDTLETELAYLRGAGYTSVSFADLARSLILGSPLPPKPVIISFDDGWESQYTYALPLLKKYSFMATFFIYTRTPGVRHYMSWDQILALDAAGMEIGSHSVSHPYLTRIKREDLLRREIFDSKRILEAHLRKPVMVFAYPFGQYNDRVVKMVQEAGYVCARGTTAGIAHSRGDLFALTGLIRTASRKSIIDALQTVQGEQPKTSAGP
jgi:peptidoglycan/xylan/chitin deacetylase (PgdA/CDA1 family)